MSINHLLRNYPGRRLSAFDGMAVTAEVWQEAHEYHRYHQRLHALHSHGIGIVSGLSVIATDPPSQAVFILPGVATDPSGNTIVVPEPTAYDLQSHREGTFCILLTYDESRPQPPNGRFGDSPYYVFTGFSIETIADAPDSPLVELARIRRTDVDTPIANARDPRQPGRNEIDLRFRPEVVSLVQQRALVGVHSLNRMAANSHGQGLLNLSRTLSQQPELKVWVDDNVSLDADLGQYTLLCLVARERFQLAVEEINSLYGYVQGGGTLLLESCHREGGANPSADGPFRDVLDSLGVRLEAVQPQHPLLQEPHFFAYPPAGYETQGRPGVWAADGVIFSTHDYGCLWQGNRRTGLASREEIRAAMEWGHNLIGYALHRRRVAAR